MNDATGKRQRGSGAALSSKIRAESLRLGAGIVGFAPVARWHEDGKVQQAFRPDAIWPQARTVIAIGVQIHLPVIESTPSINYQELYNSSNILLDQICMRLSSYLNGLGHSAIPLPRDGYYKLEVLLENPASSFSHVWAGHYAGLGTIGFHHMLITPEWGPRVRLASVLTSAEIPGSKLNGKSLCNACGLCAKLCPVKAFSKDPKSPVARMDKRACTERHVKLKTEGHWPCGICAMACPVGEDRKLYASANFASYQTEHDKKPVSSDAVRAGWHHMRAFGSEPEKGETSEEAGK